MEISQRQILWNGEEESTSSRGDSPASHSQWQASERERRMTVTSGRKCYEQYGKFSPLGLLAKMLVESSVWYSPVMRLKWVVKPLYLRRITLLKRTRNTLLKQSAQTLSERDIQSSRFLFQLAPSVRRTEGTGFGLLLKTPSAMDSYSENLNKKEQKMGNSGTLAQEVATGFINKRMEGLLPTPDCSDRRSDKSSQWGLSNYAKNRMLPTPTATDWKGGCTRTGKNAILQDSSLRYYVHKRGGVVGKSSQLNPLFVEEMMGYPTGWLVLPFLSGERKASKPMETP
ncbi:MAG: hypothetical protein BWX93_01986 [Bacteroidetes bacterium ADurb.Bin139]|nr:MAG: hypothetical protein BWX93_01986 [Bacteroidetes bacterium ADurb.Bin139]